MRFIDVRYLHLLWETPPLINRLLEFNDSPSGVAAFLDDLREREECIPLLESVPNLAEYGRPLTRYLLFLHEIASSYILMPYIHDEQLAVQVEIEAEIDMQFEAVQVRFSQREGSGVRIDRLMLALFEVDQNYAPGVTANRIAALLQRPIMHMIDDRTAETR